MSVLAVSLPVTGYLFNAFGESNDRWFFLIHFLFLVIFAIFFADLQEIVFCYLGETIRWNKRFLVNVGYLLVFANIVFNLWFCFSYIGENWKNEFISVGSVSKYTDTPCENSNMIMDDKSLYRVTTDSLTQINGRPENVAMLNDYYGLTYWFSMINGNTQSYVDALNEKQMNWRSFGFDQSIYTEAMAGCKYYLASDEADREAKGYVLKEIISFNEDAWYVYMNPYYMGMVYLCEDEVKEYEEGEMSLEQYNMKLWEMSSSEQVTNVVYDNSTNVFSCDVMSDSGERLIVALPYSDKWELYVDGQKRSLEKFNMYLSVLMEKGNHKIVIQYSYNDNVMSVMIFLLCVCVLTCIGVCNKRRTSKDVQR